MTPDTEWYAKYKEEFDWSDNYWLDDPQIEFFTNLLTSRDTYWKERVREELGEINFLEGIVGHNNRDIVLENYRKLRDTLLDNLK